MGKEGGYFRCGDKVPLGTQLATAGHIITQPRCIQCQLHEITKGDLTIILLNVPPNQFNQLLAMGLGILVGKGQLGLLWDHRVFL